MGAPFLHGRESGALFHSSCVHACTSMPWKAQMLGWCHNCTGNNYLCDGYLGHNYIDRIFDDAARAKLANATGLSTLRPRTCTRSRGLHGCAAYREEAGGCRPSAQCACSYGMYLEKLTSTLADCKSACDEIGPGCVAYDFTAGNGWCGLWGQSLLQYNGFSRADGAITIMP